MRCGELQQVEAFIFKENTSPSAVRYGSTMPPHPPSHSHARMCRDESISSPGAGVPAASYKPKPPPHCVPCRTQGIGEEGILLSSVAASLPHSQQRRVPPRCSDKGSCPIFWVSLSPTSFSSYKKQPHLSSDPPDSATGLTAA